MSNTLKNENNGADKNVPNPSLDDERLVIRDVVNDFTDYLCAELGVDRARAIIVDLSEKVKKTLEDRGLSTDLKDGVGVDGESVEASLDQESETKSDAESDIGSDDTGTKDEESDEAGVEAVDSSEYDEDEDEDHKLEHLSGPVEHDDFFDESEKKNEGDVEYVDHVTKVDGDVSTYAGGPLGNFTYDNRVFSIKHKYVVDKTGKASSIEYFSCDLSLDEFREKCNSDFGLKISDSVLNNDEQLAKAYCEFLSDSMPDGLVDASFTFSNNKDLRRAVSLPETVTTAFGTYMNCENMVDGAITLPVNLEHMDFMFRGCGKLKYCPEELPHRVESAAFAFENCKALENIPYLNKGIQDITGMFGNCVNITTKPKIPDSVQSSTGVTFGCTKLDEASYANLQKQQDAARERLNDRLNSRSFSDYSGDVFASVMQYKAMRRMGYGVVMSLFMSKKMRDNGLLGNTWMDGFMARNMGTRRGGLNLQTLVFMNRTMVATKEREERKQIRERALESNEVVGLFAKDNRNDFAMVEQAHNDVSSGLFLGRKATEFNNTVKLGTDTYKAECDELNKKLKETRVSGRVDKKYTESEVLDIRKQVADQYISRLSSFVSYYNEAKRDIDRSNLFRTDKERTAAMSSLNDMMSNYVSVWLEGANEAQNIGMSGKGNTVYDRQFELFNDGDRNVINRMLDMFESLEGHALENNNNLDALRNERFYVGVDDMISRSLANQSDESEGTRAKDGALIGKNNFGKVNKDRTEHQLIDLMSSAGVSRRRLPHIDAPDDGLDVDGMDGPDA